MTRHVRSGYPDASSRPRPHPILVRAISLSSWTSLSMMALIEDTSASSSRQWAPICQRTCVCCLNSRYRYPLMKNVSRQPLYALSYLHDVGRAVHRYAGARSSLETGNALTFPGYRHQNILVETSAINTTFDQAPYEVFLSQH